jgi:putative ATP-binding cassette transporter
MTGLLLAVKDIWRLAKPYFVTKDRGELHLGWFGILRLPERVIAWGLVALLILLNLGQVAISVRLSYFNRDWFNAIQEKDANAFWMLLITVWALWVSVLVISNVIEYVIKSEFRFRWRRWLTHRYQHGWLDHSIHYKMQLAKPAIDNPEQRISYDLEQFTKETTDISLGLMHQVSTLISFSVILWSISGNFSIPGTDIFVPGLLFWIALVYAGIGTWFAHLIGRKLIHIAYEKERREADYRFALTRLREYSEAIALMRGEKSENIHLSARFMDVVRNFYHMVATQKYLQGFTQIYNNSSSVVPYLVVAPFYFAGKVQLGIMTQTASAFARVEGALAFFIQIYSQIADYKAVVDRLTGFNQAVDEARQLETKTPSLIFKDHQEPHIYLGNVSLYLPDGRKLLNIDELHLAKGQSTLVTGPSGSGKSTLFRALAGIWPFGTGHIHTPEGQSALLLPQRPYMPLGTLAHAVSYPALEDTYTRNQLEEALNLAHVPHLIERLNETSNWAQILSGGEQQRVAIARAILLKPDWLYLDEATSALDESTEEAIYTVLKTVMPSTTLISIGHRSTLMAMHDAQIIIKNNNGIFYPYRL